MQKTSAMRAVCLLLASALVLSSLAGCRRAAVEPQRDNFRTALTVQEPAYIIKPPSARESQWWANLQIVLDEKPATDQELQELLRKQELDVAEPMQSLLEEVKAAIDAQRKPGDRWSVLSLAIGRMRKPSDLAFNIEIGQTKLFAKRPVIAFDGVLLEYCINKLARETGVLQVMPRGYNPRISWQKTDVSAYEAMNELLAESNYERKFTDVLHRMSYRIQDYRSRKEFVEHAAKTTVERGALLNKARPALIVTPKEKTPPPVVEFPETKPGDKPAPVK